MVSLGLAGIILGIVQTPWGTAAEQLVVWPTLLVVVAAIVGEIKPVRLVLGRAETRQLSTSAPFVLALVGVAGVGIAVLAQGLASIADDVINRRALKKSLFNTAQYALSVLAAGVVYSAVSGRELFQVPAPGAPIHLGALLLAGLTMVAVNWLLVARIVSFAVSQPLTVVLRLDAQQTLITNMVLLSVGGIAAEIFVHGVPALALLAGPVIAGHLFAASATRHAHAATHDSLTGLGNRVHLDYELLDALGSASPAGDEGPSLILLDLDHFKDVNDTLGHPIGDRILREVGSRLVEAAPPGASVHRLGGDEFALVAESDEEGARAVALELLDALDYPMHIDGVELLIRASVGVSVAPHHGTDSATLMKNADIALYHAKLERDRISVYSTEFDSNTVERLRILADLRTALEAGDLHVLYQPQVDLATGRTVAVEALVRWQHPTRGLIPPDDFIPLAENSGLIFPVTDLVLDTALGALEQWRADGHDLRLSVNLSARHLSDLALVSHVEAALERHQVPPSALVLEVTETGILADAVRADTVIRSIRERGVEIAIDDYGTGNASLSYLRTLQVDELKVDRSFVSRLSENQHDLIIVRSTVELAVALGLRVVAEGVEDAATAAELAGFGNVIGQGYHFSPAVTATEIGRRLDGEPHAAHTVQTGGR